MDEHIAELEKRIIQLEDKAKRIHTGHCLCCGYAFDSDDKYCGQCGKSLNHQEK